MFSVVSVCAHLWASGRLPFDGNTFFWSENLQFLLPPGPEDQRQAPPRPEAGSPPPPEQCMLGDTGNKRALRILLKCMLVIELNRMLLTSHKMNAMDNLLVPSLMVQASILVPGLH